MNIHELPDIPVMIVAIFCGSSKPGSIEEFLNPFVEDINKVQEDGIMINGKKIKVKLRAIIADSPARAFIKGVAYFNAKHGCLKCTCHGEFSELSKTMVFNDLHAPKRIDRLFRRRKYGKHHKYDSPLLRIKNLNIIDAIIIADTLHLIEFGVLRKLLNGWKDQTLGLKTNWSNVGHIISDMLRKMKLPSEIRRKMRGIDCLGHWKASEFYTFLRYTSIPILRKFLPAHAFKHFLLLFSAITILSSKYHYSKWKSAKTMLETFVLDFQTIYGKQFVTSNIHNLIHVYDDVHNFGPLNTISTYPFENSLQLLKKMLRGRSNDLEQVINRISELIQFESLDKHEKTNYPRLGIKKNQTMLHLRKDFVLCKEFKNQWFVSKDHSVYKFLGAIEQNSEITVFAQNMAVVEEAFDSPCSSLDLLIYEGSIKDLAIGTVTLKASDVMCKLVAAGTDNPNTFIFSPLLHTLIG
ncbi:uncharacterized protein LOC133391534 isoform X1 [Anopheles gambiae]|uniref:uncharacterized protein LOC133391534 isoform X1 n=2 Tax=Anopheles gambiae TaxID=7165 RepID=UPI002AC96BB8|nr:uncharacterized protein LOC133391534 isoform X1 [Anopheles gambiae]